MWEKLFPPYLCKLMVLFYVKLVESVPTYLSSMAMLWLMGTLSHNTVFEIIKGATLVVDIVIL